MVEFITGTLQITAATLSVVAGIIAISLFKVSHVNVGLRAWKYLIVALVLFAIEEVIGALVSFKIIAPTFLTHVIPAGIVGFIIIALTLEINYVNTEKGRRNKR
ncbi:hypothetical protein J4434_07740 [Candidatus Woesearchaeota archaeon]|nr:hypothetical protein [Candidatus Woesearchaeota archaeon]